jgi:transposase
MVWLPPFPERHQSANIDGSQATETEKDDTVHDTMIAVDLAKRVFQLHVASMTGHVKDRKKVTPVQFRRYMADAPKHSRPLTLAKAEAGTDHHLKYVP